MWLLQVGSGKSSLLSALLGEVQPLQSGHAPTTQPAASGAAGSRGPGSSGAAGSTGPGAFGAIGGKGPVMRGSVAYCSQVPWVNAGTIRVRPIHHLLY